MAVWDDFSPRAAQSRFFIWNAFTGPENLENFGAQKSGEFVVRLLSIFLGLRNLWVDALLAGFSLAGFDFFALPGSRALEGSRFLAFGARGFEILAYRRVWCTPGFDIFAVRRQRVRDFVCASGAVYPRVRNFGAGSQKTRTLR